MVKRNRWIYMELTGFEEMSDTHQMKPSEKHLGVTAIQLWHYHIYACLTFNGIERPLVGRGYGV
jgi:hypothetical protein